MNCPTDEPEGTITSRYAMVIAVAKRAKQLREGAPRQVESKSRNPITVAIQEIAAGKLKIIYPTAEELEAAERGGAAAARPTAIETAELLKVPLVEEETAEASAPEEALTPESPDKEESEDEEAEEPEEETTSEAETTDELSEDENTPEEDQEE